MHASSKRIVRESSPQPRLLLYPGRTRLVLLSAGAVAFVAVGALMIAAGNTTLIALGAVAASFFGSVLAYLGYRLVRPRASVIVDQSGIHDHASLSAVGFVPWHEVRRYRTRVVGTEPMLTITVTEPEAVLARVSLPRRLLIRMNRRMTGTPVNIPQIALPIRVDELLQELDGFRARDQGPSEAGAKQAQGDQGWMS